MPYDSSHRDPMLGTIIDAYHNIQTSIAERNTIRKNRGDSTTTTTPYVTVAAETEQRTYTGRVFNVNGDDTVLDLYDNSVENPQTELANPRHTIRISSIVCIRVQERPDLLPVEFPMKRDEFHAAVASFIKTAATILTDPADYSPADHDDQHVTDDMLADLINQTEPVAVTYEQCEALRAAAQPVNNIMFNSSYISRWEKVARSIAASNGLRDKTVQPAYDDDPHLNIEVINTDDPTPGKTTLLKFLTHGVPVNYLYPETHEQALRAYRTQIAAEASHRGIPPRPNLDSTIR